MGLLNPELCFHRNWFNRCSVDKKICDYVYSGNHKSVNKVKQSP